MFLGKGKHMMYISGFFVVPFVGFFTMSYLFFLTNAIKVNETSKFNESGEIIFYLTCEEHCMVPYTLFFLV